MKKIFAALFLCILCLGVFSFLNEMKNTSVSQSEIGTTSQKKITSLRSLQTPTPKNSSRSLASEQSTLKNYDTVLAPDFPRPLKKVKQVPSVQIDNPAFSAGFKVKNRTWQIVENYEAILTTEERNSNLAYLGPFLIQPRSDGDYLNSAPVVYDEERKKYGVISGQILIRNSVTPDCNISSFHGYAINACYAHLSLVIVKTTNKDPQELQAAASLLRKIPGVRSVEIEVLSQFQEKI